MQTENAVQYTDCEVQTTEQYTDDWQAAWGQAAWGEAACSIRCNGASWWCKQAAAAAMIHALLPASFWRWLVRAGASTMLLQKRCRAWVFRNRYNKLAGRYLYGPSAARLRHHNSVLQQLVVSERVYLSCLAKLSTALGPPTAESEAVWPTLPQMVSLHGQLLRELTVSHELWPRCPSVLRVTCVLEHMSQLAPLYQSYVLNAPGGLRLCTHLLASNNSQFSGAAAALLAALDPRLDAQFLAAMGSTPATALLALVILPIQRFGT